MKLFLTSYAAYSLSKVTSRIDKSPQDMRVAFIPTASDVYRHRPWVDDDRQALLSAGFHVSEIGLQARLDPDGFPLAGKEKHEAELREELEEADMIFVAGGNTFYLLEQAQKVNFQTIAEELINSGKIYVGSSAGSVIAGPDIMPVEFFDEISESRITSTIGFNWIDQVILPHYTPGSHDFAFQATEKKYGDTFKLLKLSNDDLVYVDEKGYKII